MRDSFLPTAREIVLGDVAQKGTPMGTQDIDKLEQAEAVAERLVAVCRDWDGSEMSDEAEPINLKCELLRRGSQAILSLISQVREAEAANAKNVEIEEAFDAAATARDEAGFLGTPADCIRYLDAEAQAAEAALATLKCEVVELRAGRDPLVLTNAHEALATACEWFAQREVGKNTSNAEDVLFRRLSEASDRLDAALGLALLSGGMEGGMASVAESPRPQSEAQPGNEEESR